ncbi:MAG TPA: GNAT family N-acetyltransferase [Ferruginibacter sp.]|nr:GNAT family N-acetyltransferase [Ferruginibacter sp.]
MNYTIKIVDINDPVIDLAVRHLIQLVYNMPDLLPENHLAANLQSNASAPGFFLAAIENDKIIGSTAFLVNDFLLNGNMYTGYQTCWSVVHPDYQGRNIFTSMINEAKKILKVQGAAFLYAISNLKSSKTFVNKLQFSAMPSWFLRIPNIPFVRQFYFAKRPGQNDQDACIINEEQVKEHKATQFPSAVKVVKVNESWLWGKLIIKVKFGIKVPVFYVGGIHLAEPKDLKDLISRIFKFHKVFFIQFFSCDSNSFNNMLKGWKRSKLIEFNFYYLNMPAFKHFNMMIGPLDVF